MDYSLLSTVITEVIHLEFANELVIDELDEMVVERRLRVHEQLRTRQLVPFRKVHTCVQSN